MLRKTFAHRGPLHSSPESLTFSLYSSEEIQKMSVVKVITPLSFNSLGHPLYAGLYDPRMGPYNIQGNCETCQETLLHCPGHFGHIELPLPVINPLFSKTLLSLFRMTCLVCHSATVPEIAKNLAICQLQLLSRGLVQDALELETSWTEKTKEEVDEKLATFDFVCKAHPHEDSDKENARPTRNIENIRRLILRNILSYAKMSKKCPHCGSMCRRMMLFESKIVYTLLLAGADQPTRDHDYDNDDDKDHVVNPESKLGSLQKFLTPLEARDHLRLVWLKEKEFLASLFPVLGSSEDANPTDLLFVDVVPVPPPKNRPAQMVNNMMVDHPQNLALRNVVSSSAIMIYALQAIKNGMESLSPEAMRALKSVTGATLKDKLEVVWRDLQIDIDHVMDRDKGSLGKSAAGQLMGLKQVIEKKEGLFRMHMMGKRVNHAARTVITPDPNIDIEEIGIPDVFARVLTIPVPVTPWNVHELKRLVINGPNVHPGAISVENELGQVSRLDPNNENQRKGIANRLLASDSVSRSFKGVKTVYRHLQNGDLLLLNRQPSLHRPSIMAHRARVLHGEKVFRLHYANCKHYNADFDGDEMNAHLPQSLLARSEASSLMNVCSHFLVPKDGTPLGGLIQDHIVAAVKLTMRGRFFNRSDYEQLVYFGLSNSTKPILTLPPAIMRPMKLWSGKQVVSTIIINLVPEGTAPPTFYSQAKIKSEEWKQRTKREIPHYLASDKGLAHLSESSVVFRHGELISGVLDKVQLGATPFGLCHAFYELYGNRAVGDILSAFSRLMTNFLRWEGFTLGIKDVLVTEPADDERQRVIQQVSRIGPEAAAAGVGITDTQEVPEVLDKLIAEKLEQVHRSPDPKSRAIVDQAYKQKLDGYTNQINRACLPFGLVTIFPHNNLQLLVQSGAKGSTVNTMQMSCLLGQIELEGKRPHLTISGKSLPSFKLYDTSPRAGGFITGRFLSGIRPQEFFFHCMAGREGLIDTAVKTSRSGYLQRCLVKLLEGVVTQYDGTVRDSDGSVIQFLYGEDGLDVGSSQYLKSKNLDFLRVNSHITLNSESMNKIRKIGYLGPQKTIHKAKKEIKQWKAINGESVKLRQSPALAFFNSAKHSKLKVCDVPDHMRTVGRSLESDKLIQHWRSLSAEDKAGFEKLYKRCPEPLLSRMKPDSNFGVISEQLESLVENYQEQEKEINEKVKKKNRKHLKEVIYYKALKALSAPGDGVGVLAAQSIGEPSTQMTLNTFHFAGRGEMNVTLGIPRLREILMVASANIRTPSMDIPFKSYVSTKKAEQLKLKLTRVTLGQVLQHVAVKETIDSHMNRRLYAITFQFLQEEDYSAQFYIKPSIILKYFEKFFIHQKLCNGLRRLTNTSKSSSTTIGTVTRKKGGAGTSEANEIDDGADAQQEKDLFDEMEKKGMGEDHQSSDEDPDLEDEDATQSTRKARQTEREYEEPEEEDEDAQDLKAQRQDPEFDGSGNDDPKKKSKKKNLFGTIAADDDDDDEEEMDISKKNVEEEELIDEDAIFTVSEEDYDTRVATVIAVDELIHSYDFDRIAEEHCTVTLKLPLMTERVNLANLLKLEAGKAIIHQVKNINRAFIVAQGDKKMLKTEGINILAMTNYHDLLDLDKLHCNNIHTMAEHYGIEAASRVIVKEMTDVFKAYGITLDSRHLTLIADYMTFSGTYRPFNRIGIESSPSPLQQMSFETVVTFLRDAILGGRTDELKSPSGRLILGKPVQNGTGLFQLINELRI